METLRLLRNEKIIIFSEEISNKKHIAYIHATLIENNNSIIVVDNCTDEMMEKALEEIDPDKSGYIFFQSEINIDPINNNMTPLHRYATNSEKQMLIDKRIVSTSLPVLKMKDPIRRWYNFKIGSIVAIERHDKSLYFRLCQ